MRETLNRLLFVLADVKLAEQLCQLLKYQTWGVTVGLLC